VLTLGMLEGEWRALQEFKGEDGDGDKTKSGVLTDA
jgi:hypothetical protein